MILSIKHLPFTIFFLTALGLLPFGKSNAQGPTTIIDNTQATAMSDGVINAGEYPGSSVGINSGFGNVVGSASNVYWDSDDLGNLNLGIQTGGGLLFDNIVIYIDAIPGGFPNTTTLQDNADPGRAAISGLGTSTGVNISDIFFAPGFEADFAISVEAGFAGLFRLNAGGPNALIFLKSANINPANNPSVMDYELDGFDLSDLGLAAGVADSFDYVITYLNAMNAFRSDEFHGVSQATIPGGNVGNNSVTLAAGDFNTFKSYACGASQPPTAVCQDITAYLDENGEALINPRDLDGGSTDDCGPLTFCLEDSTISCKVPVLVAADAASNYYNINTTTGAAENIRRLDNIFGFGNNALAIDDSCKFGYANASEGVPLMVKYDISTLVHVDTFFLSNAYQALDFVNDTLYGSTDDVASLYRIDTDDGTEYLVGNHGIYDGFGWMNAMAYDELNKVMYGIEGGAFGPIDTLYTIDLSTGLATAVGPTERRLASMEFGPDGRLYAGGGQFNGGQIYTLDPTTGEVTFIGNTGLGENVNSMAIEFEIEYIESSFLELIVKDLSGNADTCTALVTVLDTFPPEAICSDISASLIVPLDELGERMGRNSTDNCVIDSFYFEDSVLICENIDSTLEILLTVFDGAGNRDTCTSQLKLTPPDTLIWSGDVNTDWATEGNWFPCGVPDTGITCIIPNVDTASGNDPIVSNADAIAEQVTMIDGHLTISGTGYLSLFDTKNDDGIDMNGRSKLVIDNGGTLSIFNTRSDGIDLEDTSTFVNYGTMIIDSVGTEAIDVESIDTCYNYGSILIRDQDSDAIILDGAGASFINYDTITVELPENVRTDETIELDDETYFANMSTGVMILNNDNDENIEMDGDAVFVNYGKIIVPFGDEENIEMDGSSLFRNFGTIQLFESEDDENIDLDANFINEATGRIYAFNADDEGILIDDSNDTLINRGFILIDTCGDEGIDNDGYFWNDNNAHLIIKNTDDDECIENDNFFLNEGLVDLYAFDDDGIGNQSGDTVINKGIIRISSDTASIADPDVGINNGLSAVFVNYNQVIIDLDGSISIDNDGKIINEKCAVLDVRSDDIFNTDTIINFGLIFLSDDITVNNSGVIINYGDIYDPGNIMNTVGGEFVDNGNTGPGVDTLFYTDMDGDGFGPCNDCDDENPNISGPSGKPPYCCTQGTNPNYFIDAVRFAYPFNTTVKFVQSGSDPDGYGNYSFPEGNITSPFVPLIYFDILPGLNRLSYIRIWVDWDQNGSFDPYEVVAQNRASQNWKGQIVVPLALRNVPGAYNVRVVTSGIGYPDDACGEILRGETEDYTICIANGCGAFDMLTTQPEIQPEEIRSAIRPNPFTNRLIVETELERDGHLLVQLIDQQGRVRMELENAGYAGYNQLEIPTENLASGIYYLKLQTPDGMVVEKVIKQ